MIDWKMIFTKQKELSAHIEEKHPRQEGEDRTRKKAFALMAELVECANEEKACFKFWKEDPQPNTKELLEEYVDVIHFTAELGIELGIKDITLTEIQEDTLGCFAGSMYLAYIVGYGKFHRFNDLISYVTKLGEQLGFTAEDIKEAYEAKHKINYIRQAEHY